jgi:hypothetical protein
MLRTAKFGKKIQGILGVNYIFVLYKIGFY